MPKLFTLTLLAVSMVGCADGTTSREGTGQAGPATFDELLLASARVALPPAGLSAADLPDAEFCCPTGGTILYLVSRATESSESLRHRLAWGDPADVVADGSHRPIVRGSDPKRCRAAGDVGVSNRQRPEGSHIWAAGRGRP